MDLLNSDTTIANIIKFMDPGSASQFRQCEKRVRSVMDSEEYWGDLDLHSPGKHRPKRDDPVEPYHKSSGLRMIVMRTSFKEWRCVSCSVVSDKPLHDFYGTVVCRRCCEEKTMYRVMGEKAACKKYFLEPIDIIDVAKLERSRGVFRVIEHQVMTRAISKHGKEVLKSRMAKREKRIETINTNRTSSYNKRVNLLNKMTIASLRRVRSRVETHLMDLRVLLRLAEYHGLRNFMIRDLLDFRVTSKFSVREASENLVDLACLLSYCRRNGVLMEDYITPLPNHNDFYVSIVFINHCYGDAHFYEYMANYVSSIESLVSRSISVMAHEASIGESICWEDRYNIISMVCAEEGISINTCFDLFDEYIRFGTGDPVLLARECRKMAFLRSQGYDEDFDYYMTVRRMCACRSSANARRTTLSRCRGFPIMNRLLIDHRISGLLC